MSYLRLILKDVYGEDVSIGDTVAACHGSEFNNSTMKSDYAICGCIYKFDGCQLVPLHIHVHPHQEVCGHLYKKRA